MRRWALLLSLTASLWSTVALAYRPFDGTDASVAEPGDVEIELGPAGYLRQGAERTLIAPAARLNYGFAPAWEATLGGQAAHGFAAAAGRSSLADNELSLKHVLREGVLQDRRGASIATEFGLLLPGINDEPGLGGSVAGIVSQRWDWITVHANLAGAVTRQGHGDVFVGAILEGPHEWTVRPVAELFHERAFGEQRTSSALIGAIWQVRDTLAIDGAVRGALVNARTLGEIRLGLSFGFGL